MQAQSKGCACEKAMILGALYDAIERLKWELMSVNSDAGILMVAAGETEMPLLVRVLCKQEEQIVVTVEFASGAFPGSSPETMAKRLLDTLSEIIKDALSDRA